MLEGRQASEQGVKAVPEEFDAAPYLLNSGPSEFTTLAGRGATSSLQEQAQQQDQRGQAMSEPAEGS